MLLCVLDHPTQYDPPLWRAMTRSGRQTPVVWYNEPRAPADGEIQQEVCWSSSEEGFDHRRVAPSSLVDSFRALRPRPTAVLLSYWRRPGRWRLVLAARAMGVPVILESDTTLNEPSPPGLRGVVHTSFRSVQARLVDGFFTTGSLGTDYLVSVGCPRSRIVPGVYPVDVRYWQKRKEALLAEARAMRNLRPEGSVAVLAVCKLSERESPLALFEGFARLRKTMPGAFLVQVGDGPLRAAVDAKVRDLGLEQHVVRPGYIPYERLAAYYGAADLFVHAPLREPWGISVLEAMACGLPVVASTTVGAAADLVIHGRTGALTYAGDADDIASALALVAANRTEMGRRAFELVQRFDVSAVAEGLADFVERLAHDSSKMGSIASVLFADIRNQFGRWSV